MKTNSFNSIFALAIFALFFGQTFAQNSLAEVKPVFNENSFSTVINVDDLQNVDMSTLEEEVITIDHYEAEDQEAEIVAAFALAMLGIGAGLGFFDEETEWCLKLGLFYRLALMTNTAMFAAITILYSGISADFYNQTLFTIAANLLWFTAITRYKQVHLVYGILFGLGFGNQKFDDDFKWDINRFTASLVLGFNIILATNLSLLLTTGLLTHVRDKYENNGNEQEDDYTWGFINKRQLFAATLLITLGNSSWRQR